MGALPAHRRERILLEAARLTEVRKEELAVTITKETGKVITASRLEIDRAVFTLRLSAEEAGRLAGEEVRLDRAPGSENRVGFTTREPWASSRASRPSTRPSTSFATKRAPPSRQATPS